MNVVLQCILLIFVVDIAKVIAAAADRALPCQYDEQCPGSHMGCYKDYSGCRDGLCGCRYGQDTYGKCKLKPNAGLCQVAAECPRGYICNHGQCMCRGRSRDNVCLRHRERLLGEKCFKYKNRCLNRIEQSGAYETSGAICLRNYCRCEPGMIRSVDTCRRVRIGEAGCKTSSQCSGDALCLNGVCQCPQGFKEVSPGKCGYPHARVNIRERDACDEHKLKDRFCKPGLECVRCGNDANLRCWRFEPIPRDTHQQIFLKSSKRGTPGFPINISISGSSRCTAASFVIVLISTLITAVIT